MRLEPPRWWYGNGATDRLATALLQPAGLLYGAAVRARFAATTPYRSRLPVICIGNFTVGGAGKTPLALAIAAMLQDHGLKPAFLTRGYGGRLAGPHPVEPERDTAADVGDEALLLARRAPTVLSRKRPDGAKAIEASGADVIIMDDGFQNPSLLKDLALIAIDGSSGIGNGRIFPAGPLRASLPFQTARAQAVIMIGGEGDLPYLNGALPVLRARLEPAGTTDWLDGQRVLAFSGIGRPAKFFETLRGCGADLIASEAFPDHHMFTADEARALLMQAEQADALLVTTEKDWVRIAPEPGSLADLRSAARPLPVELRFSPDDRSRLTSLLKSIS